MTLYRDVHRELTRMRVDHPTIALVIAAVDGENAVEQLLEGKPVELVERGHTSEGNEASSVYLHDITVSGFRGIGPEVTLEVPPGPGLTVVVGRNGSGKSSFAEGFELLLTGDTYRWSGKSRVWKEGWRNLHSGSTPRIRARFQVAGKRGHTVVERSWAQSAKIERSIGSAQHHGEKRTNLRGIGWEAALDLYRPLLSYDELGLIAAGPTSLFDTLTAVLGLEPLDRATRTLSAARRKREKLNESVTKELRNDILPALKDLDDDRADEAFRALTKREWDLDRIVGLGSMSSSDQDSLRRLAELEVPSEQEVRSVVEELRTAQDEFEGLVGSGARQAHQLVQLLESAINHHKQHGDDSCPVCSVGTLDMQWRQSAETHVDGLRVLADRFRVAKRSLEVAVASAQALTKMPDVPSSTTIVNDSLLDVWSRWQTLPDDTGAIPEHLLAHHVEVRQEASAIADQARTLHSEREEKWASLSSQLMVWQSMAHKALSTRQTVLGIKTAERALKRLVRSLRSARWAPIETEALRLWENLRLQSNVDLRSVQLVGTHTLRRVDLTVDIDGAPAQALAVASQGEISCLALSLFFPRAMLFESPFRFLVIDDPIQAMDPARVDGLARVFSEVAEKRQLVVFTHDDRLTESLRRLQIAHTCKQVTRRSGSIVEVRETLDPMRQCFWDARAVAQDDGLLASVASDVIPGMCREGLEAACIHVVRRRRLGRGEPHMAVEDTLERARTLTQKTALVLFDDINRGSEVSRRITKEWGRRFTDAFWAANRGAHVGYSGDLADLINDCQGLAERIRVMA